MSEQGQLFELRRTRHDTPELRGLEFIEVEAKTVINRVPGDYLPFRWTINPYRGCSHACVYCFARPTHTYLEMNAGHDFESRIVVKVNVAGVLRSQMARRGWKGEHIAMGTNTDPYQAAEGRYRLMPGILRALIDFRNPFSILSKGTMMLRDLDLLAQCARRADVGVAVSIATLDDALAHEIEPTVAPPRQRLRAVRALADAGIRVGVAVAPVLPGLTDDPDALGAVVRAAAAAGASHVWHSALNLGTITRDAYFAFLRSNRPELVQRYERLFGRGRYAEPAYVREVSERVHAACRGTRFARHRTLAPDEAGVQLALL